MKRNENKHTCYDSLVILRSPLTFLSLSSLSFVAEKKDDIQHKLLMSTSFVPTMRVPNNGKRGFFLSSLFKGNVSI